MKSKGKVLIAGISGGLAKALALRLVQEHYEVIGIDRRVWSDPPEHIKLFEADIRKREAEDVFRLEKPDIVIHLATVTHFNTRAQERYKINLGGTQSLFSHCQTYGVKQAIFIGRHTIYGAAADTPLYRTEEEPPLATGTHPELADLVAADLYAASALWRFPKMNTSVLRLVYTLGPTLRGTLATFLGNKTRSLVPMVMGFDPLYQIMHESDAVEAIFLSIKHKLRGIYNVAGPQPVPFSLVCEYTHRKIVSLPEPLLPFAMKHLPMSKLPINALNHLKYPIIVDDQAFRSATGFVHHYQERQVLSSFLEASQFFD
jgi:UDP-glucose 4-epimerase